MPDPQREVVKHDSDKEDSDQQAKLEQVRSDLGIGESVDPLEALLDIDKSPEDVTETFTVPIVTGVKIPWTVRALAGSELDELTDRCTRYVRQGRGPRVKEVDGQKLNRLIIAAATVTPDMTDPRLKAKFGAVEPSTLVRKIMLPGTAELLAAKILEVAGYTDDLISTAGN